jgi:Chromo (CHRromatin Organisation MOdifier) domain
MKLRQEKKSTQHLACDYAPEQLKLAYRDDEEHKTPKSHVVESIVSHRDFEGERLYMVNWAGYDESENSEIPYENFNSKSIVTQYYKKLNKANPHAPATQSKRGAKAAH